MKKIIAVFVAISFLIVGCTGSFSLSHKLYKYHRSQEKWVDETIFLVCTILPIYGVTFFVDGVVLNSIEFWSGKNPVASNDQQKPVTIAKGKESSATLGFDQKESRVLLSIAREDQTVRDFSFEKTDDGIRAKDDSGLVRFRTINNEDGSVSLLNGQDQLIQTFGKAQIEETMSKFEG